MPLTSIIQKTKTEVLDCIFPKKCVGCHQEQNWICSDCFLKLLSQKPVLRKIDQLTIYACGNYHDQALQNIINYLKYRGVTDLVNDSSKLLSALYSQIIRQNIDYIASVPLHQKRLSERTFNQAELLAQEVARLLEKNYLDCLIRFRYSSTQTHLSDQERKINVKNIFQINPKTKQKIVGRTILLVDDVVTSGATITEAAKVLKQNGAYQVIGLCLASR